MEITIKDVVETKVDPAELNPDTLGFGIRFTDRIFTMAYDADKGGWHDPTIGPLESFSLHPASVCFHYGQTIFEGMKAFARDGGKSALFRPQLNLQRMNRSAQRMSMPAIEVEPVLEAMIELVRLERQWIPGELGSSLYIRPTMIGTEEFLGVRPANRYLFFIILSPVGPYFKGGIGKPIKIMASHKFTRAAEGGTGEAKCGGNYGASLLANEEAKEQGYSQVLWLDAKEHRLVEVQQLHHRHLPAHRHHSSRDHPANGDRDGAGTGLRCGGTGHLHRGSGDVGAPGQNHRDVRLRHRRGGDAHRHHLRPGRGVLGLRRGAGAGDQASLQSDHRHSVWHRRRHLRLDEVSGLEKKGTVTRFPLGIGAGPFFCT